MKYAIQNILVLAVLLSLGLLLACSGEKGNNQNDENMNTTLNLTKEWDKKFPLSDKRIGIIGICGWGGMAVNAAAIDPRIKATVASTMYDMTKITREGYFGSEDTPAQRMEKRKAMAAQRTEDYRNGTYKRGGGVIDPLPADAPQFVKDYHAYYKTDRGYHERSGNSNDGWNVTGCQSFLNQPILAFAAEIENPVLLIHSEKAHSRYFSEYAFEKMTGKHVEGVSAKEGNKELLIIPGASHVDLYDDVAGVIPYDKIESFFKENLK